MTHPARIKLKQATTLDELDASDTGECGSIHPHNAPSDKLSGGDATDSATRGILDQARSGARDFLENEFPKDTDKLAAQATGLSHRTIEMWRWRTPSIKGLAALFAAFPEALSWVFPPDDDFHRRARALDEKSESSIQTIKKVLDNHEP